MDIQLDAKLDLILKKLDAIIDGQTDTTLANRSTTQAAPKADDREVASDSELDGKYGNPQIRKDPPRWTGESYVGRPFSEASSKYLDRLASFLDWRAGKNEEKGDEQSLKYANYDRRDAARARGWARRNAAQESALNDANMF